MEIKEYLKDKKFKFVPNDSLFGMQWQNVRDKLCPVCARRIYFSSSKKIWFCRSKKHKRFVLKESKYLEIQKTTQR